MLNLTENVIDTNLQKLVVGLLLYKLLKKSCSYSQVAFFHIRNAICQRTKHTPEKSKRQQLQNLNFTYVHERAIIITQNNKKFLCAFRLNGGQKSKLSNIILALFSSHQSRSARKSWIKPRLMACYTNLCFHEALRTLTK